MDRKNFIITSTMAAFAFSACGAVVKNEEGKFEGDCETTNDILGPFFRENSPMRSDITSGKEGTKISIKGKIQKDCTTPLENVKVEIWQCDTEGNYDNNSDRFDLRGQQITDAEGNYTFETIIPGKYLNGALYRPAHIHFRVSHEDCKELISQIYFKGDPHIEKDPWASQTKADKRILTLSPFDVNSNLVVNFDIDLASK